jgi:hypothetical protein
VKRGPDRLNSLVLPLLGLLLLGAGGYGLARGYGAFGDDRASEPVLGQPARDYVSRNANWFWPLAAVASLAVAWLGLRWLLAQVRNTGVSNLHVRSDGAGTTELHAAGAAAALARDVEDYAGVRWARARFVSDGSTPEVDVTAEVHDDADLVAMRKRIDEHALPRLRSALELGDVRPRVHLRLGEPARRTVR